MVGQAVFLGCFGIYRRQVWQRAAFTLSSALCYISVSYTRHDCTTSREVSRKTYEVSRGSEDNESTFFQHA
jgi:hypothetical protein